MKFQTQKHTESSLALVCGIAHTMINIGRECWGSMNSEQGVGVPWFFPCKHTLHLVRTNFSPTVSLDLAQTYCKAAHALIDRILTSEKSTWDAAAVSRPHLVHSLMGEIEKQYGKNTHATARGTRSTFGAHDRKYRACIPSGCMTNIRNYMTCSWQYAVLSAPPPRFSWKQTVRDTLNCFDSTQRIMATREKKSIEYRYRFKVDCFVYGLGRRARL